MDANVISEAEAVLKVEAQLGWLEDFDGKMVLVQPGMPFFGTERSFKNLAFIIYRIPQMKNEH